VPPLLQAVGGADGRRLPRAGLQRRPDVVVAALVTARRHVIARAFIALLHQRRRSLAGFHGLERLTISRRGPGKERTFNTEAGVSNSN